MKTILLTIIAILFFYSLQAQTIKSLGFKSGISVSDQTIQYFEDKSEKSENKIGFYASINSEFFKSKYYSITVSAGFLQKGSKDNYALATTDKPESILGYGEYTTTINYLTFSPLIKGFYVIKNIVPYIYLGSYLDYQLSFKSNYGNNYDPNFNKTIWGLVYGGGIEFRQKSIGILFEYQAHQNFTALKIIDQTGGKITGNAFVIGVGLNYYFIKSHIKTR
jgi:hypothetical protein